MAMWTRRIRYLAQILCCAFLLGCTAEQPEPVWLPTRSEDMERGKELVTGLAACGFCHGTSNSPQAALAGGQVSEDRYGSVMAANITPDNETGIGLWSPEALLRGIRASVNNQDQRFSPDVHRGFEWMADADVLAIAGYLRALPAVSAQVERRSVSFIDRNTTGFFDVRREVKGYVPEIERRFVTEYGQYLVNHVARCGTCHNSPSGLLSSENYLAGGMTITRAGAGKLAPGIAGSKTSGLGGWSEGQIMNYLQTGGTPDGRHSDDNYCPTKFYARASPGDLSAIAKFLKALPG